MRILNAGSKFKINVPQLSVLNYLLTFNILLCLFFFNLGTSFQRLIPDSGPAGHNPQHVDRVVFCTGKLYYELLKKRQECNLDSSAAIVRIEQVQYL